VPISRDEFDRGRTAASWEDAIEGFLNSRPSEAFGVLEAARAIEYPVGRITGTHSLHHLLHRMAAQGKIDERIVRTGKQADTFYASMG
jgi:hypothetical protein